MSCRHCGIRGRGGEEDQDSETDRQPPMSTVTNVTSFTLTAIIVTQLLYYVHYRGCSILEVLKQRPFFLHWRRKITRQTCILSFRSMASSTQTIGDDSADVKTTSKGRPGLKKIPPYWYPYRTNAKARWFDREILEVVSSEFRDRSVEYYVRFIFTFSFSQLTNFFCS